MLKTIIVAELDAETENDINTELINASIEAILTNKYTSIFENIEKEQLDKSIAELNEFVKKIIREVHIEDNI